MARTTDCVVIGHRGFKAKYTENTLRGFDKCYESGATMIETDVWTTRDEVLVISHDVNTKRVFCDANGNEADHNILQSDYDDIKELRTIESGELLLTFKGLLHWFREYVLTHDEPTSEHRLMLDIKNANPPKVLQLLVREMLEVHGDLGWWLPRILLGLWHLRFVKYLNQEPYFQEVLGRETGPAHFDITHISVSWQESLAFLAYNEYLDALPADRFKLKVTAVSLIYIATWSSAFLTRFMPALKKQDLKLYSWTVNTLPQLRYFCSVATAYRVKEYGVITDSPDSMVEWAEGLEHSLTKAGSESQGLLLPQGPLVPLKFKLLHFLFGGLRLFAGIGRAKALPDFDSHVDPHQTLNVPPSMVLKVFAFLQHHGIF